MFENGPDGTPERDAIVAQAKQYLCGGRVYEDLPDATQVERDPNTGEILPYIVISFSSPAPTATDRGMGLGELDQPYIMGVQVDCWGTTRRIAGQTAGAARRVLIGFVPNESCGEVRSLGGAGFSISANGTLTNRAMEQLRLVVPMNLSIPA